LLKNKKKRCTPAGIKTNSNGSVMYCCINSVALPATELVTVAIAAPEGSSPNCLKPVNSTIDSLK
jgi:hypothetical protein